jgi:hypothetical protein
MKRQAVGFLLAAVLGLVLVLVLTQVFKAALSNLWVLIGISLFASGFSAFCSYGIVFFSDRFKHGWDFGRARDAHRKLASIVPKNTNFKEIIIVAYTANSAYRMLEVFQKKNCHVERLRMLLRSPISFLKSEDKKGMIPHENIQIDHRLIQMRAHLLGDIKRKRMGMGRVDKLEIKFYHSEPVLRGMVIDKKMGFFSIYTRVRDLDAVDYSATHSAALRLSKDGGYEEKILVDFIDWFNLVWEHGSVALEKDILDVLLEGLTPDQQLQQDRASSNHEK